MVTITVYRSTGGVWTTFEMDGDDVPAVAARVFEWASQPGCGRVVVRDVEHPERFAEWRTTTR
jgi:hypothetical protein